MSEYPGNFNQELNRIRQISGRQPYPYYSQINNVDHISDEILQAGLTESPYGADVDAMKTYPKFLIEGGGIASKLNGPLGDKYFIKTGTKCTDVTTNSLKDRSMYINNVPDGSIPFVSSVFGGKHYTQFEGLIPGALGNFERIKPYKFFQAFLEGHAPNCVPITLETIDICNNISQETGYLTNADVIEMDPCYFPNNINPLTRMEKTDCTFHDGTRMDEIQTGNHCHIKDGLDKSSPMAAICASIKQSDQCATNQYCAWVDQGILFNKMPITNCMVKSGFDLSNQPVCLSIKDQSECEVPGSVCEWVDFNVLSEEKQL